MSAQEVLDWLNRNCRAHTNWEGQFVLLAHIPGKPTTFTAFDGATIEEAVEKAAKAQGVMRR